MTEAEFMMLVPRGADPTGVVLRVMDGKPDKDGKASFHIFWMGMGFFGGIRAQHYHADPDEFVRRQESNEWPLEARKVVDIDRTLHP
jgi:hypothetical protein